MRVDFFDEASCKGAGFLRSRRSSYVLVLFTVIEDVRGGGLGMAPKEGSRRSSTEDALLAQEILLKLVDAEAMVESENLDERLNVIVDTRGSNALRLVLTSSCEGAVDLAPMIDGVNGVGSADGWVARCRG